MTVVDASVIVAAFSEGELASEAARAWLEDALQGDISAPTILLSEVSGAIARASGSESLADEVLAKLTLSGVTFAPVDRSLADEAATIARRYRIRGCDAIYVALAVRTREPLITLDDEQLDRGSAVAEVRRPGAPLDEDDDAD